MSGFLADAIYCFVGFCKLYFVGIVCLCSQLLHRHKKFKCDGLDLRDTVAIVTGGSGGIGYEVSRELAGCGAHVIIAARDEKKSQTAIARIRATHSLARVEWMALDLRSLESVHAFTAEFLQRKLPLNLLINNAGVMIPPHHSTVDGFEEQFGVNYLSHALLTGLLLHSLSTQPRPRVVTVTSQAHQLASIQWDNLNAERCYSPHAAYAQSKLAQLLFTYSLHRHVTSHPDLPVTCVAVHPGVVHTALYRHVAWPIRPLIRLLAATLYKSARQGADCVLYAALSSEVRGGTYLSNCEEVKSNKASYDRTTQDRLWTKTWSLLDQKHFSTQCEIHSTLPKV